MASGVLQPHSGSSGTLRQSTWRGGVAARPQRELDEDEALAERGHHVGGGDDGGGGGELGSPMV